MPRLIKVSEPSFDLEVEDKHDAYEELIGYICKNCSEEFIEDNGKPPKDVYDLLDTRCGAEFIYEE